MGSMMNWFNYPKNGVELDSGIGYWDLSGDIRNVRRLNSLKDNDFCLDRIKISRVDFEVMPHVGAALQIDVFAGDEFYRPVGTLQICGCPKFSTESYHSIQIPMQPAGTRISCRLSDSTSGKASCVISFSGYFYGEREGEVDLDFARGLSKLRWL